MCIYICVCVFIYIYIVCKYMYIYVYIYISHSKLHIVIQTSSNSVRSSLSRWCFFASITNRTGPNQQVPISAKWWLFSHWDPAWYTHVGREKIWIQSSMWIAELASAWSPQLQSLILVLAPQDQKRKPRESYLSHTSCKICKENLKTKSNIAEQCWTPGSWEKRLAMSLFELSNSLVTLAKIRCQNSAVAWWFRTLGR